ncbi:hypothetical protein QAD02_011768 [Eretmocerus hayati]|uniref:Uncharacterized protein n=1 Tax=Eretmocerus hayati TaxID=131215 RepID=A0ACC2NXY4_9HYME|nr:hypothetical protein QAD02_011768 [Eretmocerus hayati]
MDRFIEKITKINDSNLRENLYGERNEFVLRLLGLWYHQSPTKRGLIMLLNETLILSFVVPVVIFLVQALGDDLDLFIENSVPVLFCTSHFITFILAFILVPKVGVLHRESMDSWQALHGTAEEDEVCKHLKLGHLLSLGYTGSLILPFRFI